MTLIELYQSQGADGKNGENSRALLTQTHWFTVNTDFDPKTGEALPQALCAFLAKVARSETAGTLHDRLWRITEHARPSVERLFRALNESPRREQAMLPVHAVRELDANSFIKLSNRPGRNIREKLAGKPYLQAVRRFQSVNLPENRLLKAFVARLAELLELRQDCLGEEEDELLPKIQSWLLSDEAHAIARWDNLPPNNTLLSHRDYRHVWDAWRGLQTLNDDIARDFSQLEARDKTMHLWKNYGRMYYDGTYRFAEMPVLFDYEKFEIRPWLSQLAFQKATRKITRSFSATRISEPVCVDLAVLRPRYATTKVSSTSLCETYLWQQWKSDDESVDIELFNSDAGFLHPNATSISSTDLFFSKDNTLDHLDRAARAFVSKQREMFKNDKLIWLVPDFLNDFELEIIRRNINTRFPNAEPLPRSVAAVFKQVDFSKIKSEGFPIVVVDTIGGKTCVTKVIARFYPELKKRLPETNGFYWERCPPVIIPNRGLEGADGKDCQNYDIISVDGKGQWRDRIQPKKPQLIDINNLKSDLIIGQFPFCINLTNSPVTGGIRLHALQQRAGDIPLWRDHIPELSILHQRFCLVGKDTTVKPIRGLSVPIRVHEAFKLPAGRPFYQFPIFQGENADELGFSARLDSPAFPLKKETKCKLNLTFEYGADEPYKLIFEPLDKSFPPVRATWRRTEEVTDAPAPKYPEPLSWDDLRAWRDAQKGEVDLLEWLIDALTRLSELIPNRCMITISSLWKAKRDNNGNEYWFAFAKTQDGDKCYCNTKYFVKPFDGNPSVDYPHGTKCYCNIKQTPGGLSAFDISTEDIATFFVTNKQHIISFKERSLQNRMSLIWADARSLKDAQCPDQFKNTFNELTLSLLERLPAEIIDRKIFFLLACLHKDTTDDCVQWITEQVKNHYIRAPRAVGCALGDVSEEWQQYIFSRLASKPTPSAISVFAYAIWREQHLVERFSISELHAILSSLSQRLANIQSVKLDEKKDKWTIRNWVRATAESLELLLGLLRTRASANLEIKMLLQPHQKITKELAKQVERVTEIVEQSNVTLFSRVQLNIPKPAGDRTPDLLYALRLYLTGDDGANAIHITSVSDNDND